MGAAEGFWSGAGGAAGRGAASRAGRSLWRKSPSERDSGRWCVGGCVSGSSIGATVELGPQVGAGSAGEEAVVDTKKNWSAGGLLERERLLEVCGRSLQPTREAMERLALLETVWMNESNAGPKVLAMSDAGRGWSEAFAVRAALLKRAGRGAGSMVESVCGGSVGEGAEVGSCEGRDGRTESRKEGKVPREAEPPGTRSLPCLTRFGGMGG